MLAVRKQNRRTESSPVRLHGRPGLPDRSPFLFRKHKPNYETLADGEADALALSSMFSEFDYTEALTAIYQLPDDEHA